MSFLYNNNFNIRPENLQYNKMIDEPNFFKKCTNGSVMWGSNKPMNEKCPTDYQAHKGVPCHSIWNNSTKRKIIVNR